MKRFLKAAGFVSLSVSLSVCAVSSAQARDTTHYLPANDVIEMGKARGDLGSDIRFYFGDQPHAPVAAMLTKGITTNKKTNAANKSDEEACRIAMLSALIQMQQTARNQGANAVVNIESFYKRNVYRSNNQYECHAGAIMAGVALRGDVVRLK